MSYVHQQRDFSHSKLFITHKFIFAGRIRIVNIKLSMVKFALINHGLVIYSGQPAIQYEATIDRRFFWVMAGLPKTPDTRPTMDWMVPLIINKLKSEM